MSNLSPITIALQAKCMRDAQKNYFILIGRAKKSKLPEDFKAAKEMLDLSKKLEANFDQTVAKILVGQTLSV